MATTRAAWVELIHAEDRARVEIEGSNTRGGNTNQYSVEYRVRHKEGHYVTVLDKGLAIRDADDSVRRVVGSTIDITERKRADEALRRAREELEQRVRERTSKLAATNEALRLEVTKRRQAEDARAHTCSPNSSPRRRTSGAESPATCTTRWGSNSPRCASNSKR